MKNTNDLTRRQFLASGGAVAASSLLRMSPAALAAAAQAACNARDTGSGFATLDAPEAADLAAIAARVIPTTDTPGATEAGVVYFFDAALGGALSGLLVPVREGLEPFNAGFRSLHGGRFRNAGEAQQDDYLQTIDSGAYFGLIRDLTIFGFFAMQSYGGNRDDVGWQLIGFDGHQGPWQYPFGHYDAVASKGTRDE